MANLKYGSTGDEVKQLQQALVNAGYDIGVAGVDGSFGPATQAAVTQYQKDRGLQVDGMAGPETQGSLYSSGSIGTTPGSTGGSTSGTRDYTGTTYQSNDYAQDAMDAAAAGEWEKVMEALNNREIVAGSLGTNYGKTSMDIYNELLEQYGGPNNEMDKLYSMLGNLQEQLSQPVQAYTPSWGDKAYEELLQQAISMNYDDWTNGDQYKSLADRFGSQGKMAMQDVLGQISSRTGGLASSYATTAAQQQYNEYMSQLEEVARQMFAGERGELIENAGLARDYGEQEYGRYLDQLNMNNDRNSYALDVINQMMGYQQDKYNQNQNAKAEAQDRINAYLAAYGSLADLDPALIEQSGYTQSELQLLESYFAQEKAAALAPKSTGGGGGDLIGSSADNPQGYDALFSEAQKSGYPKSFIANNYKKYGFTSSTGLYDEYVDWESKSATEPTVAPESIYGVPYDQYEEAAGNYQSAKAAVEYMESRGEDPATIRNMLIDMRNSGAINLSDYAYLMKKYR